MSLYQRWSGGPRVNEVEPILVIFEDRKEKEQVLNVMVLLVDGCVFKPLEACLPSQFWFFIFQGENQNAAMKFHKKRKKKTI